MGDYWSDGEQTWMHMAATYGQVNSVQFLLDNGFSVDALELPVGQTALTDAIYVQSIDLARLLISRDANPNLGRPLISAINCKDSALRRQFVELLVEAGVDLNQLYSLYGDMDKAFSALDVASGDIADYLAARGAKTSNEIRAAQGTTVKPKPRTPAEEVIAHFEAHFGPVSRRAQIEVVPTGHPVAVHAIEAGGERKQLTLFTTGLSDKPMKTPKGKEEYAYAELFMQLPGNWPHTDLANPRHAWPTKWLRGIAQHAHNKKTWLGGPLTVISNEDPPNPLAPGLSFVALLLLAESDFKRSDGKTVQLFRVTPLYLEELQLERRQGSPALMRAFDQKQVPFVVDLNRPNAAK